jgi:Mlc titration factor MtfA (ptsG expression regulator)
MPDSSVYLIDTNGNLRQIDLNTDSITLIRKVDSTGSPFLLLAPPGSAITETAKQDKHPPGSLFHPLVILSFIALAFLLYNMFRLYFHIILLKLGIIVEKPSFQGDAPNSDYEQLENPFFYDGSKQLYSMMQLQKVLVKHFPYYKKLPSVEQLRFKKRVQEFIQKKHFYIYAAKPLHEMLILTSASAVQLTFGLKDYLLPSYTDICVYPGEFIGIDPVRVLAGNVSGDTISIAWNHLLEGIENEHDGKNLGLHEMAHALSMEMMVHQKRKFRDWEFSMEAVRDQHPRLLKKNTHEYSIFNDNARRNQEEFFAESVELFFEKPYDLQREFPEVYQELCTILNQDPKEHKLLIPLKK